MRTTRVPFRPLLTAVRVSRGFPAIGATMFDRARSHSHGTSCLARFPCSGCPEIRGTRSEIRPIRFCFPTLVNEHPYPSLLPAHRHRHFVGRALGGVPPTKTGDHRVSRRVGRFGGSFVRRRGRVLPFPRSSNHRASDASVAILPETGARFFAERAGRFGEIRRDRFDPTAVTR